MVLAAGTASWSKAEIELAMRRMAGPLACLRRWPGCCAQDRILRPADPKVLETQRESHHREQGDAAANRVPSDRWGAELQLLDWRAHESAEKERREVCCERVCSSLGGHPDLRAGRLHREDRGRSRGG